MGGWAVRPSAKLMPSGESFQPWLTRPSLGLARVLDEPVAVGVPVALDPVQGAVGVRQQPPGRRVMAAPAAQFAEHHDEQGGGVGGSVVGAAAAEGEGGGRAEADFVQDLAGLLLRRRVGEASLAAGQRLQGPEREAVVPREQHPRGQQRVPPEQGHEPGRARGNHGPAGVLRVEDAQRPDVFDAAAQHRRQVRLRRLHLRGAAPPLAQPAGGNGVLGRLAARVVRLQRDSVHDRDRFDADRPLAARRDNCLP